MLVNKLFDFLICIINNMYEKQYVLKLLSMKGEFLHAVVIEIIACVRGVCAGCGVCKSGVSDLYNCHWCGCWGRRIFGGADVCGWSVGRGVVNMVGVLGD